MRRTRSSDILRVSLLGAIWLWICPSGQAQSTHLQQPITISFVEASLDEIISDLRQACTCPIYHSAPGTDIRPYTREFREQNVVDILATVLVGTSLNVLVYEHQVLVIGQRTKIEQESEPATYQLLEEDLDIAQDSTGLGERTEVVTEELTLEEVLLEAQARDENVRSPQTGLVRIRVREIEKLPSFMGEVDVVKSLLLQPGISSIGEGSGGFHVRGGKC